MGYLRLRTQLSEQPGSGWDCLVFKKDGGSVRTDRVFSMASDGPDRVAVQFELEQVPGQPQVHLQVEVEGRRLCFRVDGDGYLSAGPMAEREAFEILTAPDGSVSLRQVGSERFLGLLQEGVELCVREVENGASSFYIGDGAERKRRVDRNVVTSRWVVARRDFLRGPVRVIHDPSREKYQLELRAAGGNGPTRIDLEPVDPGTGLSTFVREDYRGAVAFADDASVCGVLLKIAAETGGPGGDEDGEIFVTTESGGGDGIESTPGSYP